MRLDTSLALNGSRIYRAKGRTFVRGGGFSDKKDIPKIKDMKLFDSLPDAVSLSRPSGEIVLANAQMAHLFGYKGRALLGQKLDNLVPHLQKVQSSGARESNRAKGWIGSYRNLAARHRNGHEFRVDVNSRCCQAGRWSLILTSFHVVPEQRRESGNWLQAKKEAEARAEELSAIFDASPGVTLIARDPECRVMTGGRVTYDVHQQPHGVNLSKSAPGAERPSNFRVFRNGREVPAHELPLQKAAASGKEIRNSELTIVFNDGKSRDFLGNAAPLLAPDGKVRGAVGVFIDITERKVAERSARELYAHMLKVQDVERRRIARELHDSVGQNLTGLLLSLRALKNISARLDKESRATLSEALTAAREATRDVRTLSRLLHPPLLQEFGLLVAIRTFARGFSEASGIKVDVDLPPRKRRLHKDVEATLFRVVQEALTNVYRHSGSKRATIHMRETGRDLVLEIRDSGRGIQMSSTHPKNPKTVGVGIAGIRERLQQFDGQLELQSSRNGTVLRALLPLSRAAG